jgi:hypothetical protein
MIEINQPKQNVSWEAPVIEVTSTNEISFLERIIIQRLVVFDFP